MTSATEQRLSLWALIALVVGSMVGSGIFTLPGAMARSTGGLGAGITWVISGVGMLALAFVFQTLALRKPELDAGIFAYAKAGFGRYVGFNAALGYWTGCCLADVACLILIKATLGAFFPMFGDGSTIPALIGATVILWGTHVLVLRGVKEATSLNAILTAVKMVPLLIFIAVVALAFDPQVFRDNFWGDPSRAPSLFGQVRSTVLVTVFAFVGIEGASVYSRLARRREDVGIAAVFGLLGVLALLVLVTMLSFGVLPQAEELAGLRNPSTAGIMEHVVGPVGGAFIGISLIISVLGNYLSWSLLAAEVLFAAARSGTMPAALAHSNENGVPSAALWSTNIVIQIFLIVSYFAEYAFHLALTMTSAMTLVPYVLVASYGVKLAGTGETYAAEPASRRSDLLWAGLAAIYTASMLLLGGVRYLLLAAIILSVGSFLYFLSPRRPGEPVLRPAEMGLLAIIVLAGLTGLAALVTGSLSI